jgi:tRNA(Ile)-lysidine synthase TilS/MesJ
MTVAEVRERVRAAGLLAEASHVVAMLSGGRDSVCLLDVAVALCGAERVRALHVNYGLRTESDGDERHCRELCDLLGVTLEVTHASREEGAPGNLQAWARELRYGAARELAARLDLPGAGAPVVGRPVEAEHVSVEGAEGISAEGVSVEGVSVEGAPVEGVPVEGVPVEGAEEVSVEGVSVGGVARARAAAAGTRARARAVIATGHTASDQVETILYRLAASPGRRALLGMPASEGQLVRPLLGLTRQQTAAYCLERKLAWREDVSNDSEHYARARIRHGLVKALDAVHPAAQANVLRTAELLREETDLLDALVAAELGGRSSIAIERLRELPPALQRLIVIRLAEHAAGTFVPQAGERVEEILALGARGGRAELHVGGLAGALIEDGELRMVAIQPREQHARQARCEGDGADGRGRRAGQ